MKTPLKRPVALAPPPPSRRSATSLSSDQIYERILAAITEHRLPPGMQLVEDRLAKIFDVSRTKIREATGRLVHDRIAINIPNRGAFIASPTADEAREVFAARRLIEPELMRLAVRNATARQITSLRAHVRKETAARNSSKPHAIITLSGEFHLLVAEIAGNGFLLRTLRELESLTSLIIRLYDTAGGPELPLRRPRRAGGRDRSPQRRARRRLDAAPPRAHRELAGPVAADRQRLPARRRLHLSHLPESCMRLLLANSNTSDFVTSRVAAAARAAASPGTEIVAVTGRFGARVIGTRTELAVAEHATVELLAEHAAGCDAAIIAVSYDVALPAAREMLAIPVVGITEAALLTACMLGGRIGVVLFGARVLPLYQELIARYGLADRVAGWRVVDSAAPYADGDQSEADALTVAAANDLVAARPGRGGGAVAAR